ncbi:MAG: transglutaminase domain-containing protein [Planctomycetes bacterium]|nr:transglutaminase domain-containing protein [Planctomycetota bacterium]
MRGRDPKPKTHDEARSHKPGDSPPRPPPAATAAALLSFATLYLLGNSLLLLSVLSAALLLTYVLPWRIGKRWLLPWFAHVPPVGGIVYVNLEQTLWTKPALVDFRIAEPIGQVLAATLVVQAWLREPWGGPRGASLAVLSSLVFLVGSTTTLHGAVSTLAPAYFLALVLVLRGLRPRGGAGRPWREGLPRSVVAWGVLTGALLVGALGGETLWSYRRPIGYFIANLDKRYTGFRQVSGWSDVCQLGATKGIPESMERVLRLEGSLPEAHLRGMAFDTYAAGGWGPNLSARALEAVDLSTLHANAEGPRCRMTRLLEGLPVLFAPLGCVGLDPAPEGEPHVSWDGAFGATLHAPDLPPYRYDVVLGSSVDAQGPLCVPPDEAGRARWLALPPDLDPRVRELARRVLGEAPDPRKKVEAVLRHLFATHAYSLTTDPGDGDPVTNFLLGTQAAHCEYFASAAVILLRCGGVPTRYVTGYYGHEAAGEGAWVIRQQDAHAWAEAWIDGTGWLTVEATPGSGRPAATAGKPPLLDRLEEWMKDKAAEARKWFAGLAWYQLLAGLGAVLLLLLGAGAMFLLLRRVSWRAASRPAFQYASAGETLAALAPRFERHLRRTGLPCPAELTWGEHLSGYASGPSGAGAGVGLQAALAFARAYSAVRFGRPEDPEAALRLTRMLDELEGRKT